MKGKLPDNGTMPLKFHRVSRREQTAINNAANLAAYRKQGKQSEDSLQIECAAYLRHRFPTLLWFHVPNGGSRNKIEGAKLKRMGVLAGVSDMIILQKSKVSCIELKIGKNRQRDSQKEFQKRINELGAGYSYHIIYSFFEFTELMENFICY